MDFEAELTHILDVLGTHNDHHVLRRRVLPLGRRATLEATGQDMGVTRERVRQRENRLRRRHVFKLPEVGAGIQTAKRNCQYCIGSNEPVPAGI